MFPSNGGFKAVGNWTRSHVGHSSHTCTDLSTVLASHWSFRSIGALGLAGTDPVVEEGGRI